MESRLSRLVVGARRVGWRRQVLAAMRIVVAATVAWAVAAAGLHDREPVLAPVAAVLTVQGTVLGTVRQGAQVCAGVLLGAGIGVGVGVVSGSRWWTIALATAIGVTARYVPGLGGGSATQVPVSALLVVALGRGYGYLRIVDTAVGAAVGVLVTLVVLPPVRVPESAGALGDVAAEMARILRDMAGAVSGGWDRAAALGWLDRARGLEDDLARMRAKLAEAEESLRLNPRRLTGRSAGGLREAATALDHVSGQVRAVARGLADLASDEAGRAVEPPALPESYPALLACDAAALDAFRRFLTGDGDVEAVTEAVADGRRHSGELAEARFDPGARRTRLLGSLIEEPIRLLGEVAPGGAHDGAYG